MKTYVLGNILRGWFTGKFESLDEAWSILSRRFMLSFPTDAGNGREVDLYVKEDNPYGYSQFILCKEGTCEVTPELTEEEIKRCEHYRGFTLYPQ